VVARAECPVLTVPGPSGLADAGRRRPIVDMNRVHILAPPAAGRAAAEGGGAVL